MNKSKVFYIHTSSISKVEHILKENNISFKVNKNKKKNFQSTLLKWNLPPFEDVDITEKNVKISVDKSLYEKVVELLKPEKTFKNKWIHYNKIPFEKIKYDLSINFFPKYPIYIISLNRFQLNRCFTIKTLEKMNVKYRLCVMTREVGDYRKTLDDNSFTNCVDIISVDDNFGLGGTPQRNKCWEHSKSLGFSKFWLLDDNIDGYYYFNLMNKVRFENGLVFQSLENLIDNVKEPVGIIGHCYFFDVRKDKIRPPIQLNTKVYSSMLINTELLDKHNIKFLLKYNEDVDLVLQCLKNKLNSISCNIFLCNKLPTLFVKGGNTDTIYDNGKKFQDKLDCLIEKWGDIVETVKKHKDERPHHKVDYSKLNKNKVITPIIKYTKLNTYEKLGIKVIHEIDDLSMTLSNLKV